MRLSELTRAPHDFVSGDNQLVCSHCGAVKPLVCPHEDTAWVSSSSDPSLCCEQCVDCGEIITDPQEHILEWVYQPHGVNSSHDEHLSMCANCGTVMSSWACNDGGSGDTVFQSNMQHHWQNCYYCEGAYNRAAHAFTWIYNSDTGAMDYACECGLVAAVCYAHSASGSNSATCDKCAVCDYCGIEMTWISKPDHDYEPFVNLGEYHGTVCRVCGAEDSDSMEEHAYFLSDTASVCICGSVNPYACDSHSWEIEAGYAQTCESEGYTGSQVCMNCGTIGRQGEMIPPHFFPKRSDYEIITEPGCSNEGLAKGVCAACGMFDFVTITSNDPSAHELVYKKTLQPASCVETGVELWQCSSCGMQFELTVKAVGHDLAQLLLDFDGNGELTNALNCEGGIFSCIGCKNCSYQQTALTLIPNSAHADHIPVRLRALAATCTSPAGYLYECGSKYCDFTWIGDENGNRLANTAQYHNVAAGVIERVISPTCDAPGMLYYICPSCNAQIAPEEGRGGFIDSTKVSILPSLGHTNSIEQLASASHLDHEVDGWTYTAATCETQGYWESTCQYCSGNYIKVTDVACVSSHDYILGKAVTAEICGSTVSYQQVCRYCELVHTDADGKEILVVIDKLPHDYVSDGKPVKTGSTCADEDFGPIICSRCDVKTFGYVPKTEAEKKCDVQPVLLQATCTHDAMSAYACTKCGDIKTIMSPVEGTMREHTLDYGTLTSLCGVSGNVIRFSCSSCDLVNYYSVADGMYVEIHDLPHTLGDRIIVEASCSEPGLKLTNACVNCEYAANAKYAVYGGAHSALPGSAITYSDCTGTYSDYTCSSCKETISTRISSEADATRHRAPAYDFVIPNSCLKTGTGYMMCSACGWKSAEIVEIPAAHNWSDEPVILTPPTCGRAGTCKYVCLGCGAEKKTPDGVSHLFSIPASGKHSFGSHILESGSCELDSYRVHECLVCGAADNAANMDKLGICYLDDVIFSRIDPVTNRVTEDILLTTAIEIIPAAGVHTFGETSLVQPSCTNPGGMVRTCVNCGCSVNLTEEGYALGHDPIQIKVKAGCYQDGYIETACYRCGVTIEKMKIAATGHNLHRIADDPRAVAATCRSTGIEVYQCSNGCGYEELLLTAVNASNHDWNILNVYTEMNCATGTDGLAYARCRLCGVTNVITISAEHNWIDSKLLSAATCSEEGLMLRICEACSAQNQRRIPRLPHTLVTIEQPVSCTQDEGIITRCAQCDLVTEFVKTGSGALGHEFVVEVTEAGCASAGGLTERCRREGCDVFTFHEDAEMYPPLGHIFTETDAKAATPFAPGHDAGTRCERCDLWSTGGAEIPALDIPVMNLPKALTKLEAESFSGSVIQSVYIPDGCTSIGDLAFANCANLAYARIPDSVTEIAENAFEGCEDLIFVCPAGSTAAAYAESHGFGWQQA